MEPAIVVCDLRKRYKLFSNPADRLKEAVHPLRKQYHRDFWALDGLSFTVPRGQTVGVLGRNGSGKSTLLQVLAGTMPATSGDVVVNGRIAALLELGAGFDPNLTGRENCTLYGAINGISPAEMRERILLIEQFADIGEFFDQPVRTYSSGMFARLGFAAAIQINPEILVVDEILGVGDARFQEKCAHRMRELQNAGTTVVVVSHSTDQVLKICQSAILIEGGRLECQGEVKDVVDAYHSLLYAGPPASVPPVTADPVTTLKPNAGFSKELNEFFASSRPLLPSRPYYNKDERRLGNGAARIEDVLVAADDRFEFSTLTGREQMTLYVKIAYRTDLEEPHLGWAMTTREGMLITGTNTLLCGVKLPPVRSGDICIYAIKFQTSLNSGDYFLNIGANRWSGDWVFLDVRRSVIHLNVQRADRCTGFFDTDAGFERVSPSTDPQQ